MRKLIDSAENTKGTVSYMVTRLGHGLDELLLITILKLSGDNFVDNDVRVVMDVLGGCF